MPYDWKKQLRRAGHKEKTFHFVVGDVHGCYAELLELEEKSKVYAAEAGATPFFVLVGDLIDRGPNSLEVVKHVMRGVQSGTHYCVAGNHEAIFLELFEFFGIGEIRECLATCRYIVPLFEQFAQSNQNKSISLTDFARFRLQMWQNQGGEETLSSFGLSSDPSAWETSQCSEEIKFLSSLPLAYFSNEVCVTHALVSESDFEWALTRDASTEFQRSDNFHFPSLEPLGTTGGNSLEDSQPEAIQRLQAILWNREQLVSWPNDLPVHVSGHTPADEPIWYEPLKRIIVDTGCVFGRSLTAYCPETKGLIVSQGYHADLGSELKYFGH
jgi:hypothetical protein